MAEAVFAVQLSWGGEDDGLPILCLFAEADELFGHIFSEFMIRDLDSGYLAASGSLLRFFETDEGKGGRDRIMRARHLFV